MTGRPPDFPRYERIRLGLQVCAADDGCPRAPSKGTRGFCRAHWKSLAHRPRTLGPGPFVDVRTRMEVALAEQAAQAADAQCISVAEWVRRAVARALESQP